MRLAQKLAPAVVAAAALSTFSAPATAVGVSAECPAGTQGVVVSSGGSDTYVCTSAVHDVKRLLGTDWTCDICPNVDLPPK